MVSFTEKAFRVNTQQIDWQLSPLNGSYSHLLFLMAKKAIVHGVYTKFVKHQYRR